MGEPLDGRTDDLSGYVLVDDNVIDGEFVTTAENSLFPGGTTIVFQTRHTRFRGAVEFVEIKSDEMTLFDRVAQFIDLMLDSENAESAIANLEELYRRRLARNSGHAKRWLIAQVIWIAYGRAMELLRTFSAARAGK